MIGKVCPSVDFSSRLPKVAVLSVTDPFWAHMVSTLGDVAEMKRITSRAALLECLEHDEDFDLVLIAHWRWIIPDAVLDRWRCVGFHTSPLPLGRGGSPIHNQITTGDYESEVCAFRPNRDLDAGDIYLRRPISLESGSIEEILDQVALRAAKMAREILLTAPEPKAQSGDVTTFQRRHPSDSHLSLAGLTLRQIYDRIRMVDGFDYPRAFQFQEGWILEFCDAQLVGEEVTAKVTFKIATDEEDDA